MTLLTMGAAQLDEARLSSAGRASRTLHSGARLRQTLIALTAGTRMNEHQSPGDATVQCLQGRVTLHTREHTIAVAEGELVDAPPERHDVVADEDSLIILTVGV
ncbi:cupin domain-containing protein [Jiangella muralis]|uniref:cupin domain-containing protein n=1 Tax=Jiangella muralis TaxID=702383 RepID=UPI00069D8AE4|nr:cupin domain-containing protein [Jiangella muralis]